MQCCITFGIDDAHSPPNKTCKFCDLENSGCTVYAARPLACKNFECFYYKAERIDEQVRPDKCKIIFEKLDCGIILGTRHPEFMGTWQQPEVQRLIKSFTNAGYPVVITSFTMDPKIIYKTATRDENQIFSDLLKAKAKDDHSILYH